MTALFANTVLLRGFLAKDAEAPSSDHIQNDSFAVLLLATVSGIWDLGSNEWKPRTDWHRVICPGAFFCGLTRGMRRGDYLEVEGELRPLVYDKPIKIAKEPLMLQIAGTEVHATRIERLEYPSVGVDTGEGG